jgi:predicted RNase H-like nuclease
MDKVAGVDGCKGGWLVAISEDWPAVKPTLKLCPTFNGVIAETASCERAVVDIPIGLPKAGTERSCDVQATKAIYDRRIPNTHSRVFDAPPRSALQFVSYGRRVTRKEAAEQWEKFRDHIMLLRRKKPTKQEFDFSPKVKEVDDAMNPELQQRILEFHPEPAWKRIARSTLQSKHTASGLLQRLDVLQNVGATWISDLMGDPTLTNVNLDDLLDAIVGLDVAHNIGRYSTPSDRGAALPESAQIHRYPEGNPEMDEEKRLRMEIWY